VGKDNLVTSTITGALAAYLGVAGYAFVFRGEVLGHTDFSDVALTLGLGVGIGALYWAICGRRERVQRKARAKEEAAIRAME
jgi:hypothetical protein